MNLGELENLVNKSIKILICIKPISKAQQSCDPATALGSLPFVHKMIR